MHHIKNVIISWNIMLWKVVRGTFIGSSLFYCYFSRTWPSRVLWISIELYICVLYVYTLQCMSCIKNMCVKKKRDVNISPTVRYTHRRYYLNVIGNQCKFSHNNMSLGNTGQFFWKHFLESDVELVRYKKIKIKNHSANGIW